VTDSGDYFLLVLIELILLGATAEALYTSEYQLKIGILSYVLSQSTRLIDRRADRQTDGENRQLSPD